MAKLSFAADIIPLFAKYVEDMKDVQVNTGTGTHALNLSDYDSVKYCHIQIQQAIHGYDFLPNTNPPQLRAGASPLPNPNGRPGEYLTYVAHAMPLNVSGGPDELVRLPQEAIDTFDAWIVDGMLP